MVSADSICPYHLPHGPLAQLEEQLVYTQRVGGSSPSGSTVPVTNRSHNHPSADM